MFSRCSCQVELRLATYAAGRLRQDSVLFVLKESSSVLPFLTAYDPLGGSSTSIDPLGALQSYGTLADMLLPGVTTITTRSRYLSMMCTALANAETHTRFPPGAAGLLGRRKAIEPFERLWAVACIAAHENGQPGAADGLRGSRRARRYYRELTANRGRVSPRFRLLLSQGRTGAVGTYWTSLIGGQLIHDDTGGLAAEGRDLAREFPEPPLTRKDREPLADPQHSQGVSLSFSDLTRWADECHLVAAERSEKRQLAEALCAVDQRECMAQALIEMATGGELPERWDIPTMQRLRRRLAVNPVAVRLELPTVVDAVVVMERFHEAVLNVFETLLWWGTVNSGEKTDALVVDGDFQQSVERSRRTAGRLREFQETCDSPGIRAAVDGVVGFAHAVDRCSSGRELLDEVLRRHHRVQSGKLEGGVPKRDWITRDGAKLLRPSPRFQRPQRPPVAEGRRPTHPYRVEQFVHMLGENDVLPAALQATDTRIN